MNRKEQVKQILKTLLKTGQATYTKPDIELAIMDHRGMDPRTLANWFNYLWRMQYLIQPSKDLYRINFKKVPELEEMIDTEQKRLYNLNR